MFTPQKYNAKFVACEEWFADAALIGELLGIDLTGKVMLTSVLHHFESFVVNGVETVTGSETANEAGVCPLIMDANLGDEFEVTFRFKENNEAIIDADIVLAGFTFTPISELILREHDFKAYGDMSAKVFEAYQMYYNICLHKISICTSQKVGELSGELDMYGLISHRVNFVDAIMSGGKWRTTPIPEDAYVELSDNDAFGQDFVDGSSETDYGLLTVMTMPKSVIAGQFGLPEELVHDVEVRRIPYIND